jgi:hypothetical protein
MNCLFDCLSASLRALRHARWFSSSSTNQKAFCMEKSLRYPESDRLDSLKPEPQSYHQVHFTSHNRTIPLRSDFHEKRGTKDGIEAPPKVLFEECIGKSIEIGSWTEINSLDNSISSQANYDPRVAKSGIIFYYNYNKIPPYPDLK